MKVNNININCDIWDKFTKEKSKEKKKKILDHMINSEKVKEEENCNLTPKEIEMKKQLDKINLGNTASKVAKGEYVSDEDLKYLEKTDPDLLVKSRYMNMERKRIENEVKSAKTKKRAKEILAIEREGAVSMAITGISTNDRGITGITMINPIDKAEENSSSILRKKDREEENAQIERVRRKKKGLMDWFRLSYDGVNSIIPFLRHIRFNLQKKIYLKIQKIYCN